jgi:hypothetical protein
MKDFTWTFKRFRFPGQTIGVVWHGERIKTIKDEPMNPLREIDREMEASDLDWFDDDFNHITGGKDEVFTIMERQHRLRAANKRQAGKPKISYIMPD